MSREMPGRPEQRDVETAALRAFDSLLPTDWETDERRRDFGIDLDVEIFSEGRATGLKFGVQVKGTSELGSRPSVPINWTTWNYWSSQADPVLVVLWDMSTGRLWWEWSHRFDASFLDKRTTKSFSFLFPEFQVWNKQTPDEVRREVEAWRAWATPYAFLPIDVSVRGSGTVAGVPVPRIVAALRSKIRGLSDVFQMETRPDAPHVLRISVDIEPESSVVWLSGGPSATLHYESLEMVETGLDADRVTLMIASDIVLLMSRQLGLMNALGPAARVAGSVLEDASVVYQPDFAVGLLQLLIEENRIDDAIHLLSRLLLAADSLPGVVALLAVSSVPNLVEDHRRRIATALRDMAWFQEQRGDGGAELAYNGAQLLRSLDPLVATELMDEASRLDPAYRERGYWWRERGGTLFLSKRYEEAVMSYERAFDMGDRRALPLLADALLFAGRYRDSLELFRRVIDDDAQCQPEWRLKAHVLEGLISITGIERQQRDTKSALAHLKNTADPKHIDSALGSDLLCPDALRELAISAEKEGERSVDLYTAEALVDPLHAHAWLRALRGAVLEDPNMLDDLGSCARRFCGPTILEVLESEDAPLEIVDFVELLFAEAPGDPDAPMELRIVAQGSPDYVSVDMGLTQDDIAVTDLTE